MIWPIFCFLFFFVFLLCIYGFDSLQFIFHACILFLPSHISGSIGANTIDHVESTRTIEVRMTTFLLLVNCKVLMRIVLPMSLCSSIELKDKANYLSVLF